MDGVLSSSNIKREILANSGVTDIRKKIHEKLTSDQEEMYLEIGEALEHLTKHKGWSYVEAYMMKFIMSNLLDDDNNGLTKGFVRLMHYIDQMIKVRNDILEKRQTA